MFLVLIFLNPAIANGQLNSNEEIIVSVNVQRIGSVEIPAIIHDDIVYLPVKDLFNFLKINNNLSADLTKSDGFFIEPKSSFTIDKNKNRIVYQHKIFNLNPSDIISTKSNLYLRSDYFGSVFGLHCAYSFRDLTINIKTAIELPALIELRQQQMRLNIKKLIEEKKADTIVKRSYPMFRLGMADWMLNMIQHKIGKTNTSNINLNIDLGGVVAGGETNLYLKYNNNLPFNFKEQIYNWRYVNNDNAVLRQVILGKIFTQSTSTVIAPITGIQITNTPTTHRKSYGTYRISDKTEPGSMVELYVNNILVNYTKADASGFYSFEIPLVYGNSIIKLRFYGLSGQENTREQYITIPFNFIPLQQMEYTFTAGIVDNNDKDKFLRAIVNYGLARRVTIGGGMEYLSSVAARSAMPFVTASTQLTSNLLLSGEYTHGVRAKSIISLRLPSNLQFDLNYIKYKKGQTAIKNHFLEERKAVLSMPIRSEKFTGLSKITINQVVLSNYKFTNAELLLSGLIWGVGSNITTNAQFRSGVTPEIYSNLSFTLRLPKGLKIIPLVRYNYSLRQISTARLEAEKKIFKKAFLNISYEKNIPVNNQHISMTLRYNFSFAQTSFTTRRSNDFTTSTQFARGSLMYDDNTNHLGINNHNNVGKGGLIILPFLDLNSNGRHDPGEPKVTGFKFRVNGGQIERNKDTTIRVFGLTAYAGYFIEIDNSFENIAWQISNKSIKVFIDPNHSTLIQIPISVMGEASGTVILNTDKGLKGMGNVIINFFDRNLKLIAQTTTEQDGYFNFIGLTPGKYTARIDEKYLVKQKMLSSSISFTILPKKDGDVVEDIKFIIQRVPEDCKLNPNGSLKDSDSDGVPDCIDKELITPAYCLPTDADGIGRCIVN